MAAKNKILQIMPATDWCAVFLLDEEPWVVVQRIPGFALVRDGDDGTTFVEGLQALDLVDLCSEMANFHCYAHTSDVAEMSPDWIEEAKKDLERKARLKKAGF